jgi:hypothetical protein
MLPSVRNDTQRRRESTMGFKFGTVDGFKYGYKWGYKW